MRIVGEVVLVVYLAINAVVWLGVVWQVLFGGEDKRFAGAKLWYRS